jgi:hypothetical protein
MKPKKRQKLCHNCEGEIDVDVIVCPFCAADLREEKPEQRYSSFVSQVQQMGKPPSSMPKLALDPVEEETTELAQEEPKSTGVFVPTLLFTMGVQLVVLGLLMLLFSHKGEVLLKWDARFWFLYLFAAVPFLVFGYKAISKV